MPAYISAAEHAGMNRADRENVIEMLAMDPKLGELMVGTGGARRFRIAGRGTSKSKSKSGGYRIISYFGGDDVPVFLLTVFSKGERANLTAADKSAIKAELADLADDYRKGREA